MEQRTVADSSVGRLADKTRGEGIDRSPASHHIARVDPIYHGATIRNIMVIPECDAAAAGDHKL